MDETGDWLSSTQSAQRLGISSQRVRQLLDDGQLVAVRTSLGHLFDPASVEELVTARSRRLEPVGV